jgi:hypothetical protein
MSPAYSRPSTVLDLARVGDDALQALGGEVLLRDDELAVRRHLAPVQDDDARLRARARPAAVRVQQRVHDEVPRRLRPDLVARRNCRMMGSPYVTSASTSLYAAAAGVSALYSVKRSPPRSWVKNASSRDTGDGSRKPGVVRAASPPSPEPELAAEHRSAHGALVRALERRQQGAHPLLQERTAPRQEARAQHGAERAVAEEQAARRSWSSSWPATPAHLVVSSAW